MMNSTTPPNTVKAVFPIKGNDRSLINSVAAAGYNLVAHIERGIFMIQGDAKTVDHAMSVFSGGMRA